MKIIQTISLLVLVINLHMNLFDCKQNSKWFYIANTSLNVSILGDPELDACAGRCSSDVDCVMAVYKNTPYLCELKDKVQSESAVLENDEVMLYSMVASPTQKTFSLPGYPSLFTMGLDWMTYFDALTLCKHLYGPRAHLLWLNTQEKAHAVYQKLRSLTKSDNSLHSYWMGLNDITTEGVFVWTGIDDVNETLPLTFAEWAPWEPNDFETGEDCATVDRVETPTPSWNDFPCHAARRYICEKNFS